MTPRSTSQSVSVRVQKIVASGEPNVNEFLGAMLGPVRDRMAKIHEAEMSIAKTALVFIIAFELLSGATEAEVEFTGIKVKDISLVHKLLPAAIAFMFSWFGLHRYSYNYLENLHNEIIKHLSNAFYSQDLERLISAPTYMIVESYSFTGHEGSLLSRASELVAKFVLYGIAFFPVLYLLRTYGILFSVYSTGDPVVWLSLVTSAMLILKLVLVGLARAPE